MMNIVKKLLTCATIGLGLLSISPFSDAVAQKPGEWRETRSALVEWLANEKELSQAEQQWMEERTLLTDMIAVLESEIALHEDTLDKLREQSSQSDLKKKTLLDQQEDLQQATGSLSKVIEDIEQQLRALYRNKFPEPLRKTIAPLYQHIPVNGEGAGSLSQRMQNVIGTLNQAEKFNNSITLQTDLEERPGGKTIEIKKLYLGLGYGYFTDTNGSYAGIGYPAEDGWVWHEKPELADRIKVAIEVYENPWKAAYVDLPVSIK